MATDPDLMMDDLGKAKTRLLNARAALLEMRAAKEAVIGYFVSDAGEPFPGETGALAAPDEEWLPDPVRDTVASVVSGCLMAVPCGTGSFDIEVGSRGDVRIRFVPTHPVQVGRP